MVQHVSAFLRESIKPKFNEHKAKTRDSQGKMSCKSCGADYLIRDVHLDQIKLCLKCTNRDRGLVPKQHDDRNISWIPIVLQRNVIGLEKIINTIEHHLMNCEG